VICSVQRGGSLDLRAFQGSALTPRATLSTLVPARRFSVLAGTPREACRIAISYTRSSGPPSTISDATTGSPRVFLRRLNPLWGWSRLLGTRAVFLLPPGAIPQAVRTATIGRFVAPSRRYKNPLPSRPLRTGRPRPAVSTMRQPPNPACPTRHPETIPRRRCTILFKNVSPLQPGARADVT